MDPPDRRTGGLADRRRPRPLGVPRAEHLVNSTDFLNLEVLPRRIMFVGGGILSFELAHIAASAGANVTKAGPTETK